MGFKFRRWIFREDEVISPQRILENMRILGFEINGNLDRDNLPAKGITSAMIKSQTCNKIVHKFSISDYTLENGGWKEIDSNISVNSKDNDDFMLIAHFGCWYEWSVSSGSLLEDLITVENPTLASGIPGNIVDRYTEDASKSVDSSSEDSNIDDWAELREFYVDFEMRVNGEVIAKSEFNSFFRKRFHVSLVGAIAVPAGDWDARIYGRIRRNKDGKIQDVDGFEVTIKDRTLVLEMNKR